jgi:outer membrane receptor protein involved in Fe transport
MRAALFTPLCLWLTLSLAAAAQETAPNQTQDAVQSIPVQALPEAAAPIATEQNATPVQLEAVVVTGEKLGRQLSETASSVRVLTGRDLNAQGDEDAFDALRRVGNASENANGQFTLRGINSTGVDASEFGRATASVYVDGVALDRIGLQTGATEAFDVEQVEVLRGNQSTSQGRNALAGGIVVETRDPTETFDLSARALGVPRDGNGEFGLAFGGPLIGSTAYRLVAHARDNRGEVRNTTLGTDDWARENTRVYRAKLAWRPALLDGLDAVASVQRSEADRGVAAFGSFESFADAPNNRRTSKANTPDFYLQDANLFSLQAKLDLATDRSVVSTSSVQVSDERFQRDGDFSNAETVVLQAVGDGLTVTQELRYQFKGWRGFSGLVGAYGAYFDSFYDGDQTGLPIRLEGIVPGAPGRVLVDFDFGSTGQQTNAALFTEVDYAFTPKLTGTFGLRYDYEQSESTLTFLIRRADAVVCSTDLALPGEPLCAPGVDVLPVLRQSGLIPESDGDAANNRYDALLPKLGLRYAFTPGITAFGTFSIGYRAGGADTLFTTGEIKTFEPETTFNYETGLRTAWLNRRLNVDLNVFTIQWRDQQVQQRTEDGSDSFTANAARSELRGLELESRFRIGRRLRGYTSLGLVKTEFKDYVNNGVDLSGNEFGRAPRTTGSVGFTWQPQFFGAQRWFVGSSLNYTAASFAFPDNDARERSDAATVWDGRVGYDGQNFSAFVFGRNLLNRDYATARLYDPPMDQNPEEGQRVMYGPLRQLGLRFEGRF